MVVRLNRSTVGFLFLFHLFFPVASPVLAAAPPMTFPGPASWILASDSHGSLKRLELLGQCPVWVTAPHPVAIHDLDISPNNRLALAGRADGVIILLDLATGRRVKRLTGHTGAVNSVSFSKDGQWGISGSDDGFLRLWDLKSGRELQRFEGVNAPIHSVAFSPDQTRVVAGSGTGELFVWDVTQELLLWSTRGHQGAVGTVSVSTDGLLLLSSGADGKLRIWHLITGAASRSIAAHDGMVMAAGIFDDGLEAWSHGGDGWFRTWNVADGQARTAFRVPGASPVSVAVHGHKRVALFSGDSRNHTLFNLRSGQKIRDFSTVAETLQPAPPTPSPDRSTAAATWTEPLSGIAFIRVSGGCFNMGCGDWSERCTAEEKPLHEVCLDDYWLGRTEVTQKQWRAIMGTNPSKFRFDENLPVEQVSWEDAHRFICRLNRHHRVRFRLPTEAEWEYACREKGKERMFQPHHPDTRMPMGGKPLPVAAGTANALGLHGMRGNVWEWTADIYAKNGYERHDHETPLYVGDESFLFTNGKFDRVERGGSANLGREEGRCTLRDYDFPDFKSFFLGLRLAVIP